MITKILAFINLGLSFSLALSGEKVSAWIPTFWILMYFLESIRKKNIIIHIGENKQNEDQS